MLWMLNKRKGYPNKRKIISRINGYHGVTLGASSLTAKPYNEVFGFPLKDFIHTDCPHFWKYGLENETEENFTKRMADNLSNEMIPRHTPSNPYNYSGAQLAERKKCLKDLEEVYPNLPFAWLEMVYDFEKNTPREEIQKIIDNKSWEKPGKFTLPPGSNGMWNGDAPREYPSEAN